jgi:predicted O-methyltransferase YrrM
MDFLNHNIENYIGRHTSPEDEVLARLYRETHLKVLNPRMLSGHVQGVFLEMISRMVHPRRVLEIGTYTGYSAICLARGLSEDGILHTIEVNPELAGFSKRYFKEAGVESRIIQHTGDALKIIPLIGEMFDLVFIDAAKEYYPDYYHSVFRKVKSGGFILADNALWDGKVAAKHSKADKETIGIAEFNNIVQKDERVQNVLLAMRDGMMMIRKL